jgi:hypothetical protein
MRTELCKRVLQLRFISFLCCRPTRLGSVALRGKERFQELLKFIIVGCLYLFSCSPTRMVVLLSHHRSLIINFANLAFAQNCLTLTSPTPRPLASLPFLTIPFQFSRAHRLQSACFYNKNKCIPFEIKEK